jgi:hypothetical protein
VTVTDFPCPQPKRKRLPNRRMAVSETIEFVRSDGGLASYEATIGFDDQGRPKEIFLFGAKAGSDMALALADTAVALSVALQHGVTAQAMALSVSRNSDGVPVSVIGAALDLLARLEKERDAA